MLVAQTFGHLTVRKVDAEIVERRNELPWVPGAAEILIGRVHGNISWVTFPSLPSSPVPGEPKSPPRRRGRSVFLVAIGQKGSARSSRGRPRVGQTAPPARPEPGAAKLACRRSLLCAAMKRRESPPTA